MKTPIHASPAHARRGGPRSGQALVEFVVALVIVLVLFAGLLQIGSMGLAHTDAMIEARHDAGAESLSALAPFSAAQYVSAVTPGPDQVPYSRDDVHTPGFAGNIGSLVTYAHPQDLARQEQGNAFTLVANSAVPESLFGLVQGEARRSITLFPIVRELLYRSDDVDVQATAWMTWTEGLY